MRAIVWLVFVVTVLILRNLARKRALPPPAPRRREGPQVVGFPCAKCGERIIFDKEAAPCADCGKPIHLGCMPHAHDAPPPYRG